LQISWWIQQWKNFENPSTSAKVAGKSIEVPFFDSQCKFDQATFVIYGLVIFVTWLWTALVCSVVKLVWRSEPQSGTGLIYGGDVLWDPDSGFLNSDSDHTYAASVLSALYLPGGSTIFSACLWSLITASCICLYTAQVAWIWIPVVQEVTHGRWCTESTASWNWQQNCRDKAGNA